MYFGFGLFFFFPLLAHGLASGSGEAASHPAEPVDGGEVPRAREDGNSAGLVGEGNRERGTFAQQAAPWLPAHTC